MDLNSLKHQKRGRISGIDLLDIEGNRLKTAAISALVVALTIARCRTDWFDLSWCPVLSIVNKKLGCSLESNFAGLAS